MVLSSTHCAQQRSVSMLMGLWCARAHGACVRMTSSAEGDEITKVQEKGKGSLHQITQIDPVARLESFRALKLSRFESFRALKC